MTDCFGADCLNNWMENHMDSEDWDDARQFWKNHHEQHGSAKEFSEDDDAWYSSSWYDDYWETYGEKPPGADWIWILFMLFPICVIVLWIVYSKNYISQNNSIIRNNNRRNNGNASGTNEASAAATMTASKLAKLDIGERISLYSEAFDQNQNQMVLSDAFGSKEIHAHETIEDVENGQTEDPDVKESSSIHLGSDDALSPGPQTEDNDEGGSSSSTDGEDDASSSSPALERTMVHPRNMVAADAEAPGDLESGNNSTLTTQPRTNGNCVICFEDMSAGDMVVWSENNSCPHVFHKDCIVSFFAHRKKTAKEIELANNPCPVCRQTYVTFGANKVTFGGTCTVIAPPPPPPSPPREIPDVVSTDAETSSS